MNFTQSLNFLKDQSNQLDLVAKFKRDGPKVPIIEELKSGPNREFVLSIKEFATQIQHVPSLWPLETM